MASPRGGCHHCPLPRKHQHILWCHWPCSAGLWLPVRQGHQPRSGEHGPGPGLGVQVARPLPACPTSFSLCSMTLFVCLQEPQAEEAPVGRAWSRRMSVGGDSSIASFSPPPAPCLGPLGTPPYSLPSRTPEGSATTPRPYSPLPASCKELVPGVQGRKQNCAPCSWAQCLKFYHQYLSLRLQASVFRGQEMDIAFKSQGQEKEPKFATRHKDTIKRLFPQTFVGQRWCG